MKKALALLVLVAAVAYGFAMGKYNAFPYQYVYDIKHTLFADKATDTERNTVYLQKKLSYEIFPGRYDYVFVGDSLTENGRWSDMFPDYRVGNRGIAGDDTAGILARLDAIKDTGAKKAFILAGTNDIDRGISPESIASNLIEAGSVLNKAGMDIVIQSTLYSGETLKQKNSMISKVNALLKDKAAQAGFVYIDINKVVAPDGLLLNELSLDDTHINTAGYERWRELIKGCF